jgi:hypothetical protein
MIDLDKLNWNFKNGVRKNKIWIAWIWKIRIRKALINWVRISKNRRRETKDRINWIRKNWGAKTHLRGVWNLRKNKVGRNWNLKIRRRKKKNSIFRETWIRAIKSWREKETWRAWVLKIRRRK